MSSVKKAFRLSEEAAKTLEAICKEKHMNQTAMIEEMILTYSPEHNRTAAQVAAEVKTYLDSEYKGLMKKFVARTRGLDINQQLCLEMLNSIAAGENISKFSSTDDAPSSIYKASRKHLSEKIARQKQEKDWREIKE